MTAGPERRVLVLSTFEAGNANVIRDYLFSFNAHSRHEYRYVFDCRILDGSTDFSGYDVILIFWSLYLLGPHLGPEARAAIRRSPALKVLLLQDEYRDVRAFNAAMDGLGVQVMLTCVDPRDHETFYPRASIPSLEGIYTVLTGYVPESLRNVRPAPDAPRAVDIGYRARELPYYLGDLGQEKTTIARRFADLAWEHGFRADISDREADRIYGGAWLAFLRSCRFALGSGSGASVVDFTGEIRRQCDAYLAARPGATYEEVREKFFAGVDGKVVIDTISPRIFESAAFGSTLVLHDGPYAGLLEPDLHYIRVRKDYSNLGEVLDRMRDGAFCRALADAAHRDLVASGRYGYRAFAARFDEILDAHVRRGTAAPRGGRPAFYWVNYWRHGQGIVPRGQECVSLPTPRSVARRAWRIAGRAFGGRHLAGKGFAALRLVFSVPELRVLLGRWAASRALRAAAPAGAFAKELTHLALIRRAVTGGNGTVPAFRVDLEPEGEPGAIRLVSRPTAPVNESGHPGGPDGLARAEALLREGRVDSIRWDHRAVGRRVPVAERSSEEGAIAVGEAGVAEWPCLAALGKAFPKEVARALRATVGAVPPEGGEGR